MTENYLRSEQMMAHVLPYAYEYGYKIYIMSGETGL